MFNFFKNVALLWGLVSILLFSQPTPSSWRGGLITNETGKLPADWNNCGKLSYFNFNTTSIFALGEDCNGEKVVLWGPRDGQLRVVARESDAAFKGSKLLWSLKPFTGADQWSPSDVETRPEGFVFNTTNTQNGNNPFGTFPGAGGTYKISSTGNLEVIIPRDGTITYRNQFSGNVAATVLTSSLPWPNAKGDGEFFFLRTTSGGVQTYGKFLKIGTAWTLVLQFQISPIPGITSGLGQIASQFGVTENADGTISFMQSWSNGTTHADFMVFNPKTKELKSIYTDGSTTIGSIYDFAQAVVDTQTGQRYWRLRKGAFGGFTEYVTPAPTTSLPTKWERQTYFGGFYSTLSGISAGLGAYLIQSDKTSRGDTIAVWNAGTITTVASDGDTLPGGYKIGKLGNTFGFQLASVPVQGCTVMFAGFSANDSPQSLWRWELPNCNGPKINAVVNAASHKPEFGPGSWMEIYGLRLGSQATWDGNANTTTLGGASVSVCGRPATLSFNSGETQNGWQLNAQIPDSLSGKCAVIVTVNGIVSNPFDVIVTPNALDLFSSEGRPIVTHADYSLVGPSSPARTGEVLMGWGTGNCSTPVTTIGGMVADVKFAGRVAPGLCQVNFVVPMVMMTSGATCELRLAEKNYVLSVATF